MKEHRPWWASSCLRLQLLIDLHLKSALQNHAPKILLKVSAGTLQTSKTQFVLQSPQSDLLSSNRPSLWECGGAESITTTWRHRQVTLWEWGPGQAGLRHESLSSVLILLFVVHNDLKTWRINFSIFKQYSLITENNIVLEKDRYGIITSEKNEKN